MPKPNTANYRKKYITAKKELEKARESMERKEDTLHNKIYRFNSAKKAQNFFEEKWKRLSELLQKSRKLKNKKRSKKIEEEMAYLEQNIDVLNVRRKILTKEIKEENQKKNH